MALVDINDEEQFWRKFRVVFTRFSPRVPSQKNLMPSRVVGSRYAWSATKVPFKQLWASEFADIRKCEPLGFAEVSQEHVDHLFCLARDVQFFT